LILLRGAQPVEIVGHRLGFVVMTLNGVKEGDGTAAVQQFRARANTPERRSAHFCGGFLAAGLSNSVAGTDVVQQEVAVRTTASPPLASRTGTRTDSPQMRPPVAELAQKL